MMKHLVVTWILQALWVIFMPHGLIDLYRGDYVIHPMGAMYGIFLNLHSQAILKIH